MKKQKFTHLFLLQRIVKSSCRFIKVHLRSHRQVTAEHYEVFKVDWMKQRIIR